MDESYLKNKEVEEAMDTLEYISADDEVREIADLRERTLNDKNSEITTAEENSRLKERKENAKIIAETFGVSIEKAEELLKKGK